MPMGFMHRIIYTLGVYWRSPEIKDAYNQLKKSETYDQKTLENNQLIALKKLLKKAYSTSLFYRDLYDKHGVNIDDIQTLSDIEKLPTVTKKDLLNHRENIQNKGGYRKLFLSETSGSTGEPLVFYRHSEWDAAHRAAQQRGYSWYDIKPWDRNGYFWGYDYRKKRTLKIRFLDSLLNRFRLFSYTSKDIDRFAKKLNKAVYLEGYSSMIYEVAKRINTHQIRPYHLKLVKGTSEKIFPSYHAEVKQAFGQPITSEYGAAETGIIAFECPKGNMHVVMENVIVETQKNEAIITNLHSDSFPIIRYKLGDTITLNKDKKCACGMHHDIIEDVLGRVGQVIYGKLHEYPSLTLYYVFKNMALNSHLTINYQAVQHKKGSVDLYLDQSLSDEMLRILQDEWYAYFAADVDVRIHPKGLQRSYDHKFKDFISYVTQPSK